jgi:flagellar L-ring protein precursor FlgH
MKLGLHLAPLALVGLCGNAARAQSLLDRPPPALVVSGRAPDPAASLRGVSLFLVTPPEPKGYKKNDIIEIIINETSQQASNQKLDSQKSLTTNAAVNQFPSLPALLDWELRNGMTNPASMDISSKNNFLGDGKYTRSDSFTARIAATILEVKPNGTLVLEARKAVNANGEDTTMVLSGICRPDDITVNNTVQSAQLANLTLTIRNEGDTNNTAKKGILTRLLDTIFNF